MTVTFIGHANLRYDYKVANKVLEVLEYAIEGKEVTFYLGLNGNFDYLAKRCCLKYKEIYKNARLVFVTPYLDDAYLNKIKTVLEGFDEILYPDLEKTPRRFAIAGRNKFMIDHSQVLIAFASFVFGNAHKYVNYAKKRGIDCFNIEDMLTDTYKPI